MAELKQEDFDALRGTKDREIAALTKSLQAANATISSLAGDLGNLERGISMLPETDADDASPTLKQLKAQRDAIARKRDEAAQASEASKLRRLEKAMELAAKYGVSAHDLAALDSVEAMLEYCIDQKAVKAGEVVDDPVRGVTPPGSTPAAAPSKGSWDEAAAELAAMAPKGLIAVRG